MAQIDLAFQLDSYPSYVFSYRHHMTTFGVTKAQAKQIVRKFQDERVVRSNTHQVAINQFAAPAPFGAGTWLSIKRVDKGVIAERDDLARIMRTLLPGHGGFELLPAPSRLVDTANQYHVFAFLDTQLNDMVSMPLGPAEPREEGFAVHRLQAQDGSPQPLVAFSAGALGDWRELYELKESRFPGCEGFLYFHSSPEHPYHGRVLCLDDPALRMPFGFRERAVADTAMAQRMGATQRALDSYGAVPSEGVPGID